MRTKVLIASWLLASLAGAPFLATAQAAPTNTAAAEPASFTTCVTSEQLRHYQIVRDPQLSPNGKLAVWVQSGTTADGPAGHLWLAPVDGSVAPRQITYSSGSDKFGEGSPAWMPDGSAILFTARRGEGQELFRLPMQGGEAVPLPLKTGKLMLSVGQFAVSPDGQWLAFSARQPQTEQQKQDEKDKKDAVIVGEDKNPNRIWLYSFATKTLTALTPLTREARGFAWNPQSTEIAIVTAALGNADERGPNSQLEIVTLANPGAAHTVTGVPATVFAARFSPNGEQLAFVAQSEHDTPPGVTDVYVIPAAGGTPKDLTGSSPYAVSFGFHWNRNGNGIYVEVQRRTHTALLEFPLSGKVPAWKPAATPIASGFGTNQSQSGWVFVAQSTDRMPQVVYARAYDAAGTVLSHANASWPANGWQAATTVSWKGPNNLTVEGLYFSPAHCAGAAPVIDGKTPMILMAHGGPTGAFTQNFSPFVQWLTSQGWAVLEVNPRGSTGYGWQFTAGDRNDLGGKDFLDEMAGVD
ncbi:MAG: prolyl oligopeptidase family serine peptidase, partial [Gammaproteobacteria bacterium]